jgi:hypothetical protein
MYVAGDKGTALSQSTIADQKMNLKSLKRVYLETIVRFCKLTF